MMADSKLRFQEQRNSNSKWRVCFRASGLAGDYFPMRLGELKQLQERIAKLAPRLDTFDSLGPTQYSTCPMGILLAACGDYQLSALSCLIFSFNSVDEDNCQQVIALAPNLKTMNIECKGRDTQKLLGVFQKLSGRSLEKLHLEIILEPSDADGDDIASARVQDVIQSLGYPKIGDLSVKITHDRCTMKITKLVEGLCAINAKAIKISCVTLELETSRVIESANNLENVKAKSLTIIYGCLDYAPDLGEESELKKLVEGHSFLNKLQFTVISRGSEIEILSCSEGEAEQPESFKRHHKAAITSEFSTLKVFCDNISPRYIPFLIGATGALAVCVLGVLELCKLFGGLTAIAFFLNIAYLILAGSAVLYCGGLSLYYYIDQVPARQSQLNQSTGPAVPRVNIQGAPVPSKEVTVCSSMQQGD